MLKKTTLSLLLAALGVAVSANASIPDANKTCIDDDAKLVEQLTWDLCELGALTHTPSRGETEDRAAVTAIVKRVDTDRARFCKVMRSGRTAEQVLRAVPLQVQIDAYNACAGGKGK